MRDKLLVGVLGYPNSGKSHTWDTLFGRSVKTGKNIRRLDLHGEKYTEVYLVNGSAEERRMSISDIIKADDPPIVLCSLEYSNDVQRTLDYFTERGYFLYIHWLNPGFRDAQLYFDTLGLTNSILSTPSLLGIRNGHNDPKERVEEIRDYIYGWAESRGLVCTKA